MTRRQMKDVLGDALLLSFRLLKVGGAMMFDDYWMRGVARARVAFKRALRDSLKVLFRNMGTQSCFCTRLSMGGGWSVEQNTVRTVVLGRGLVIRHTR